MNKPEKTSHPSVPVASPARPRRFALKISDHLHCAEKKRYYNEQLFCEIAPRYDFITRALSFWRDAAWKRDLVAALPVAENPFCLDVACGTGDIALLLAAKYPKGRIVGLDITEPMLARARARSTQPHVAFVNQDMGSLAFAPGSVDILSGGYALRNAPNLESAVAEFHRVLKPGAIAAFLDFSKPRGRFPEALKHGLLKLWTGFWGLALHWNHEVYGYIAESLRAFPDREELRRLFHQKGFTVVDSRLYFFGVTELLIVRKNEPEIPAVP
jgi:ubiquinone/menaquinone biosynthesis methyltransferase